MQNNRKILQDALLNLPEYTPEDKVWDKISGHLDNNFQLATPSQLSEFEPPESVWKDIDTELSRRENLTQLIQYSPPEEVWENIENHIDHKNSMSSKTRTIQLIKWISGVAAVLLIGFLLSMLFNNSHINFDYSEEWVEITVTQEWTKEDQEIGRTLKLLCNEKPTACRTPEFKKLEDDLAFLNLSKQNIISQLSKYDSNTELEIMLVKIELERTNLIKEMIAISI